MVDFWLAQNPLLPTTGFQPFSFYVIIKATCRPTKLCRYLVRPTMYLLTYKLRDYDVARSTYSRMISEHCCIQLRTLEVLKMAIVR